MNAALHIIPICAVLTYALASIWYARALVPELEVELSRPRRVLAAGLFCHVLFIALLLFGAFQGLFTLDDAASRVFRFPATLCAVSGVVVALFLLLERRLNASIMGVFIAPLAAMVLLLSAVLFHFWGQGEALPLFDWVLFSHVVSLVVCHAVSLFAFGAAVALILKERLIRRKEDTFFQKVIPALTSLDAMLQWSIAAGLASMSIGLVLGYVMVSREGIALDGLDPRIAWSIAAFAVYSGIAFVRVYLGWRGSRLAWLAVFGCGLLLGSALGVNLAGESFHAY